jgi:membrane associated rhomboid family serine protease
VCTAQKGTCAARRQFPLLTISLCAVLSLCLAAQLAAPQLLTVMQRDAVRIRDGQWYRLFTAPFFQDGWLIGGVWNIATLGLVGGLAEQMLARWQWACVYSVSAIAAELVGLYWQPIGAGNSIAVFGLSGAAVAVAWQRSSDRSLRAFASLSVAAAALLAVSDDIHGAAFGVGVLAALVLESGWSRLRE